MRHFVWWKCRSVFSAHHFIWVQSLLWMILLINKLFMHVTGSDVQQQQVQSVFTVCRVTRCPVNTSLSGSTRFGFFFDEVNLLEANSHHASCQRVLSWSRWTLSKKYVFNSHPDTLMITYARCSLSTLFNHCRAKCGKRPKSQRKCPGFGERDEYWKGGGLHFLRRVTSGLFSLLITTMNILPLLSHPSIKPGEEGGGS